MANHGCSLNTVVNRKNTQRAAELVAFCRFHTGQSNGRCITTTEAFGLQLVFDVVAVSRLSYLAASHCGNHRVQREIT